MSLKLIEITSQSDVADIQTNFEDIAKAINNKQLAFHYLNLYTLKGSVSADSSDITLAYNLLNLNEALLIIAGEQSSVSWRNQIVLVAGDYLVKTATGPLKISGPTTGYYLPAVNESTGELTYTYTTTEPTEAEVNLGPFNIRGESGRGHDETFTCVAGGTTDDIFTIADVQEIIQIYHEGILIDYPYTIIEGSTPSSFKVKLNGAWTGAEFTIRVR